MRGLTFEKPKKGIHYQNAMPSFQPFYGFTGQQRLTLIKIQI